jgi:pilus assembly protein Flp/PilA
VEAYDMKRFIARFAREERGATAIEYGILALMIGVAIIGGATLIGSNLIPIFDKAAATIK